MADTPAFKRMPFNGTVMALVFMLGQVLLFAGSLWVSNGYVAKGDF